MTNQNQAPKLDKKELLLIDGITKTTPPPFKILCPANNANFTNPYGTTELSCVY